LSDEPIGIVPLASIDEVGVVVVHIRNLWLRAGFDVGGAHMKRPPVAPPVPFEDIPQAFPDYDGEVLGQTDD
jgi:hypothetical protein